MGFSVDDGIVRGDLFNERGKWKYTVAIDMREFFNHEGVQLAVLAAIRSTPESVRGVKDSVVATGSGFWLVVLEPSHAYSHPVMIQL